MESALSAIAAIKNLERTGVVVDVFGREPLSTCGGVEIMIFF